MKKVKFTNGVQGKGFAAALALSICAVGISTYAAYSGAVKTSGRGGAENSDGGYDDNVFLFTEPAETVNAEQFGIPKEDTGSGAGDAFSLGLSEYDAESTAQTEEPTAEPVSADEAGLFFKSAKTLPISGGTVINPYSGGELVKSETLGVWKTHDGADIAAAAGTAVSSMMKGTVKEVKNDPLWGICVVIDHGDEIVGHYCGLAENVTVKEGQTVAMGEIIGQVGTTSDIECKLEPHLHFGVTVGGAWTDPIKFVES